MITNKGANVDLIELSVLDPATGKASRLKDDPLKRVDLQDAMSPDVDGRLLATIYDDDKQRIYWKDKSYEADYNCLKSKLPGREIGFTSHTSDENVWVISVHSDVEPGEVYLFDRKAKKLALQYRVRDEIPRGSLAEEKSIRYKSSDGLEIPAYLTLPKGVPAKDAAGKKFLNAGNGESGRKITVDPKTVTKAARVDLSQVRLPTPAHELMPGRASSRLR